MRKIVLSFIITMSLMLTSGISIPAQEKLCKALQQLEAVPLKIEITAWYPDVVNTQAQTDTGLFSGWMESERRVFADNNNLLIRVLRTDVLSEVLPAYNAVREDARRRGGGASLAIHTQFRGNSSHLKDLGEQVLAQLGGQFVLQEMQEGSLFSAAAFVRGWGEPIVVGEDKINLQIVLRSDNCTGLNHLYIIAPVLLSDL